MTKDIPLSKLFIITVALLILAAIPRLYHLGELGFYGDEETSALPAYSLAKGHGAIMPSGMPYHRAIPLTWLNAASARIFGLKNELSYRIPSAVFGILTIPLLFFFVRSFAGSSMAIIAALTLALSEWHIITSREARMYSPFLFFYLATAYTLWLWLARKKTRYFLLMILSYAGASSMHALGLTAILFALTPIAIKNWFKTSHIRLLAIALVGATATHLYHKFYVNTFNKWIASQGQPLTIQNTDSKPAYWILENIANLPVWAGWLAFSGLLLGLFYTYKAKPRKTENESLLFLTVFYGSGGLTGLLIGMGQFHAALLCLVVFLILYARPLNNLPKNYTALALAMLTVPWFISMLANGNIITAIKHHLMMPFPYLAYMFDMSPGLIILFIAATFHLITAKQTNNKSDSFLRACLLVITIMLLAIGSVMAWGGIRYLFGIYPFIIILSAFMLIKGLKKLISNIPALAKYPHTATLIGSLIIASGMLGGHGVPQAIKIMTLDYGEDVNKHALGFPFYPDHQGAGEFVKKLMLPGDTIIAQDMLQQMWYINKVDFWLGHNENVRLFLYQNKSGQIKDIYVNSTLLRDEILDAFLKPEAGRVWLITSGESEANKNYYLSKIQAEWLKQISSIYKPIYIGRDGITKVYLLNYKQ